MLRREVIKMSGGLFGLGKPGPSRFPYPGRPQPAPAVGPSSATVVRANRVIVFGPSGGVFVYSGTPATGNLIASITKAIGIDPYGNHYLAGVTSYFVTGPFFSSSLFGGQVFFNTGTSASGPWNETATIFYRQPSGGLALQDVANGKVELDGQVTAVGGTASSPTQVTTDGFNAMTLLNGWAAASYARYRLNPDRTVAVQGIISGGTLTNGTSIWTAPAGYVPSLAATQSIPVMVSTSTGAAGVLTPRLGITSAGNLLLENIPTGTTAITFNGSYSLD